MPYVKGFLHVMESSEVDNTLPGQQPGSPEQGLPPFPSQGLPKPPPGVWPPPTVAHPIVPGEPSTPPGTIWPSPGGSIDNTLPSKTYWMIAYCPALGWCYVSVDPSLRPEHGLPEHGGGRPDHELPEHQPGIDNSLPSHGHPDQGLPGAQPGIDNTLPTRPTHPSQGLPPAPSQGLPNAPARPGQLPGQTPTPRR